MDSHKQIKQTLIYLIPSVFGIILPVAALPILTRFLSPEDFGVFALAQVYAFFLSGLANFGLLLVYERNFFEYEKENASAALLYSTVMFVLTALLLFGFITFIFRSQLSQLIIGTREHADILFFTFCAKGLLSLKNYFLTFYKNVGKAMHFSLFTLAENALTVVISVVCVVFLSMDVMGLVIGQLLTGFFLFFVCSYLFIRRLRFEFDLKAVKDSLKVSFPLTPKLLFKILNNHFDKYMIGLISTVDNVGFYSIGQKIANLGFIVMSSMGNVFTPEIYRRMFNDGDTARSSIGKYVTPFLYFSTFFCLLIGLFAEEAIYLLTPAEYYDAINIVMVLTLFYGVSFLGKNPALMYAKKTSIVSLIVLFSIVLNVGLNIPFILKWGAIGAAWATFIAGGITVIVRFYYCQKYYFIEWEYKEIFYIIGIFFVGITLLLVFRLAGFSYFTRFILKVAALSVFSFYGWKLNFLSKDRLLLLWSKAVKQFRQGQKRSKTA